MRDCWVEVQLFVYRDPSEGERTVHLYVRAATFISQSLFCSKARTILLKTEIMSWIQGVPGAEEYTAGSS